MPTFPESPVEAALALAGEGHKILWLDRPTNVADAVEYAEEHHAARIRRVSGDERRQQVAVEGGGMIYFRASLRAARGLTVDAVFCAEKFRPGPDDKEVRPALAESRLGGRIYQLFERVE